MKGQRLVTMTPAAVVGRNIRRLRRADETTQETLAWRASVHRTQITLIERGRRTPGIDTFLRLAGALEVEPAVLLEGVRWEPPAVGATGHWVFAEDAR
jgi:transcriptional regulator with XRE-family HTH domain